MFLPTTKLYAITDRQISGLSHAEQVILLSEGGATLIQLREKTLSPREFFTEAERSLHEARRRGVCLIINDRVDIALALKADGVHLGQDDLPPEQARKLLGDGPIIGFSTHNVRQALQATKMPIDYLAIGPIFPTQTKANPEAPIGTEGLRQVRRMVNLPLVAIGGIRSENGSEALESGADILAVVSALLSKPGNIRDRTQQWLRSFPT